VRNRKDIDKKGSKKKSVFEGRQDASKIGRHRNLRDKKTTDKPLGVLND
jgi:hypothetical protein